MQGTENVKEDFETLSLWPRDPNSGGIGEDGPGNTNKRSLTKVQELILKCFTTILLK